MVLQHILMGFIIIGVPLMNIYELRTLKANMNPSGKIKVYARTIVGLWVMASMAWISMSPREVLYFDYVINLNWIVRTVLVILFLYIFVTTVIPLILLRNQNFRNETAASFQERSFILPVTTLEKLLFVLVAISVGICEEVIFRSFLVGYLSDSPLGLSIIASIVVSGLIFGLGHFHQGLNGIISATVFGLLMSYIFLKTGNLLLPIMIHIIYDLKVLLLARVGKTNSVIS